MPTDQWLLLSGLRSSQEYDDDLPFAQRHQSIFASFDPHAGRCGETVLPYGFSHETDRPEGLGGLSGRQA